MSRSQTKTVALIIAHPDDETLWAGGTILLNPTWKWFIVCLCRKDHAERAQKFYKALKVLKSEGIMGNLDDGPEQKPLEEKEVALAILDLLPFMRFDLIITHNPAGEYTRHIRHEEISKAVINLWYSHKIVTNELWTFAYEDGMKEYYPKPVEKASIFRTLTKRIWLKKYNLMTEVYGFKKTSWEAETTPKAEAFWQFTNPEDAKKWLTKFENQMI
jgi:LmbE family N-acetylglucosaminyl deacetylase